MDFKNIIYVNIPKTYFYNISNSIIIYSFLLKADIQLNGNGNRKYIYVQTLNRKTEQKIEFSKDLKKIEVFYYGNDVNSYKYVLYENSKLICMRLFDNNIKVYEYNYNEF